MTGPARPAAPAALAQAAALRVAFPSYAINVIMNRGERPRFEAASRDGGNPYCLITSDAREIWQELRRGPAPRTDQPST